MAVVSRYFEIHARAEIDGYRTELTSEVYRDPTTGRITLLSRDFGKRLPSIVEAQEAQDAQAGARKTDATVHPYRCIVRRRGSARNVELARMAAASTGTVNWSARGRATWRCWTVCVDLKTMQDPADVVLLVPAEHCLSMRCTVPGRTRRPDAPRIAVRRRRVHRGRHRRDAHRGGPDAPQRTRRRRA